MITITRALLLTLCGCAALPSAQMPDPPLCLIVTTADGELNREDVRSAAEEWNETLGERALSVDADCAAGDELVPVALLDELPKWCPNSTGCTYTLRVNDRAIYREVVVSVYADWWTVYHELGHLLGAQDPYYKVRR